MQSDENDNSAAPAPTPVPNSGGILAGLTLMSSVGRYYLLQPANMLYDLGIFTSSRLNPETQIPDLAGKVILVTGGNAGLGKETILQLAKHHPSRIYLGARSEKKAQDAIASIEAELSTPVDIRHLPLDLTSFTSIRSAAQAFQAESERLDLLILNAGIMAVPPATTEAGHEIQMGTNHVGHFLLTKLLMPVLLQTAKAGADDVRIVSVSSVGHSFAPSFDALMSTPALLAASTFERYGASKAANILFAAELARRHPEITTVSVHPGAVMTDLYETVQNANVFSKVGMLLGATFMPGPKVGALNHLWAAAGAERKDLVNGAYYTPVGRRDDGNRYVEDAEMGRTLWEWTEGQIVEKEEI